MGGGSGIGYNGGFGEPDCSVNNNVTDGSGYGTGKMMCRVKALFCRKRL